MNNIEEITAKIEARLTELGGDAQETKSSLDALGAQFEEMQHGFDQVRAARVAGPTGPQFETPGSRLIKENREDLALLGRVKSLTFKLEGGLFPTSRDASGLETKTTITSGTVGSSTPGILVPQRVPGIVSKPRRRLTLRDVLPSRPTEGSAVEFVRENVFTNAASPQVEASDKDESALTFEIVAETVRTLAHWLPATKQVLDDFQELARFVDGTLMYGLKLVEEQEILTGSGTGQHLSGLVTDATAYAGTYDAANDNQLDKLRHALTELEVADEQPDFIVLNPVNYRAIQGLKTEDSGTANTGAYLAADPLGGVIAVPTLWGLPVVATNTLSAGNFLVGSSMRAEIHDRQEAVIEISTEHSDYFIKNMVAIRCEERIALTTYRATGFVYGTF